MPYTIRTGIEPDQWTVVVHLPRGTIEKRVQSTKRKAQETACAIIDKWLDKSAAPVGERPN